jgi:hypothetical protein
VESEPVVKHLRIAIEESGARQDLPFQIEARDKEVRGVEYRLPWVLKNRNPLYLVCILLGEGVFLTLRWIYNIQLQVGSAPAFVCSVIAIALPLVTAFGTFRRSGRWAEEYLLRATHLGWFTRETCVAAAVGLIGLAVAPLDALGLWQSRGISLLAGCAWGLALATLVYLAAVILEIIHCSRNPHFANAASANTLSEQLLDGFLRNAYLSAFIRVHQERLDDICKSLNNVDGPNKYFVVHYHAEEDKHKSEELRVPLRSFHIETQFLDYHLPSLMKLDGILTGSNSRLTLTPHWWTQADDRRGANIGLLTPPPAVPIQPRPRWFRPQSDFCTSVGMHSRDDLQNLFLHETALMLSEFDTRGYRLHLGAVKRAASEFAMLWADPEVRRQFRLGREKSEEQGDAQGASFEDVYRWIWFYVRLLGQILHHTAKVEQTPYMETAVFVRCHQDAYEDLLEECARVESAEMFGLILRLMPHFYNTVHQFCESQKNGPDAATKGLAELTELRAKWGFVYVWPSSCLGHIPPGIEPAKRWRFLIFLHQAACVWIRNAKEKSDKLLVRQLVEGLANVMKVDADWRKIGPAPNEADPLMARHWLILGGFIREELLGDKKGSSELLKELTPDSLQRLEPEWVIRFYADHKRVDESDPYFQDWAPDPHFEMRPLGGGGVGDVRSVPQHEEEMRLAFLWLLLMRAEPQQPLPAIPVNVAAPAVHADLKKIIDRFRHDPTEHHIWRFPPEPQKHWIEDWLDRCTALQVVQENRKIAEAPIDEGKKAEFGKEFEERFRANLVLVRFLIDVEAYELQENLDAFRPKTLVPKTAVIAPPLGLGNTLGKEFGGQYAHGLDREFVRDLLEASKDTDTRPDYKSALEEAAAWLQARGCPRNKGLLILLGPAHVSSLLMEDAAFVPAWREAVGVAGLEGRYKGFAVWEGWLDQKRMLIAVDLRELRPLRRPAGDPDGPWTEVELRELTDEEIKGIQEARTSEGKPPEDALIIQQNCVADISVKAQFVLPEAPPVKIITVGNPAEADASETE